MPEPRPILIAGAGIGGLTLALALARKGIEARVIERAPRLEEVGAGLQISPNASRVLDALGLGPALDKAGVRPDAIRLLDGRSGAPLARIALGAEAEKRWRAPYRLIHRAALQGVLNEAVRAAGVEVRLGTELVDFSPDGVEVSIRVRTQGGDETISARGLVGADGVRSVVRTVLGGGSLRFSGQIAWRATLARPGHTDTTAWLGPSAHLVAYPLDRAGTLNLVAVTPGTARGDGWAQPGEPEALLRIFRTWAPDVRDLLATASRWMTWPLYDAVAGRGGGGAVTLLGDAAHPVLPHLAQGAALAIEDAAVLAARLAATPDGTAAAFRSYEAGRAARTNAIQTAARRNGEIFRLSGLAALARDAGLRLLGPQRLAARFDWVYGHRAE